MAVVKNMMVRAGADFSAITTQSKKASSSMRAMQTSVTRSCSAMEKAVGALKKVFAFGAVAMAARRVYQAGKEAAEAYDQQAEAEAKLARAMRNTMNASNEEIQSVLDLASAQQKLGVIGDEVQLAGAQELSTYLSLSTSLQTLIPVMNDMAAQQYGYNVTAEQTTTIATMLGKVMNGQVNALSRYGYTFDEAQEKILKFGTEEQRAAVLAQVVEQSVRGMNQALAQTPTGRMKQLSNTLGDIKERFGQAVRTLGTVFLPLLNKVADILAAVATLANKVAQAIANVFGGKAAGSEWKYTPGEIGDVGEIADDYGDVASGIDDATDSTDKLTKATQKAKKAAEEYRQQADFDTLHVLSWNKNEEDNDSDSTSPTSSANKSGTSGNSGASGSSPSIQQIASGDGGSGSETIGWLEKLLEKVKEKWNEFKEGLDLDKLKDAFANLKDALAPIVKDIGAGLVWLWENALKPLATWTINELAPRLVDALANSFRVLHDVFKLLEPILKAIWPILKWLAEIAAFAVTTALDQLNQVLKDLHSVLSGDADPLTRLRVALYGLIALDLGLLLGSLIELVNTAGEFAVVFGTATTAVQGFSLALGAAGGAGLLGSLGSAAGGAGLLSTALGAAGGGGLIASLLGSGGAAGGFAATLTGTMVPALGAGEAAAGGAAAGAAGLLGPIAAVIAIVAALGVAIYECVKHWDEIKDAAGKAWDWTKQKWNGAGAWFKSTVWEPLKKWGKDSFATISTNFKANIEQIKSDVDSTKSAVKQKLQNAGNWFKTSVFEPVKSWAKNAGENVAETAANAKNSVKQKLQNAGNWFKTSVFEPVKNRAKEGFGEIVKTSAANVQQMKADWNGTKEAMAQHLQAIRDQGREAFSTMLSLGTQAGNSIRSAFQSAYSTITSMFGKLGGWFKSSVFGQIATGAQQMVDKISGLFEKLGNKLEKVTSKIKSAGSSLAGKLGSLSINIPHLANGAVIPPNREFTAVLGDQTSGRNIETPERLLRQIMRQEMAAVSGMHASAGATLSQAMSEGNTSGLLLSALDEILDAIIAGHDIILDDTRVSKTVRRIMREQGRIAGAVRA